MLTSAQGLLASLKEQDPLLQEHALKKLFSIVDYHWAEISEEVSLIESLHEAPEFRERDLAAALASKCFYHLEEYDDALRLALGSGSYFDINVRSEFVETMIAKCIDEYKAKRVQLENLPAGDVPPVVDARLEAVVERMFLRCFSDGEFTQAVGIAIESRRLDMVEQAVVRSGPKVGETLAYCFDAAQNLVTSRSFRLRLLKTIIGLYNSTASPDYLSLARCYQYLGDTASVARMLLQLLQLNQEDSVLTAFQICFDLCENDDQKFLAKLLELLPQPDAAVADAPVLSEQALAAVVTAKSILNGQRSLALNLDFVFRHNNTDPRILALLKSQSEGPASSDSRSSLLHHAAVVAHGYMNCGSTIDVFLRDNIHWLAKATNWERFSATASQGVVHKGNMASAMKILEPYLPKPGSSSPYSEGGALYALGLIFASKGTSGPGEVVAFLQNAIQSSPSEVLKHGGALGLGLACMGAGTEQQYSLLSNTLNSLDSAVAGEAAGLSIGLLLLGRLGEPLADAAITDCLALAHETKHEKVIRGIGLGMALIAYGQEEIADGLIEQMITDKDHIIRYGGMFAIALAYVGTASNGAIQKLLHIAVSDVSDDVRRAAVSALGFVLLRNPEQVPRLVSLLAESYNPHVRYGSCIAIGVACARTGSAEAIRLLEPMLNDVADFVRQGALMAMAMVLQQESETRNPKAKAFREKIRQFITERHWTAMTKMGAVLAQGIIDAGGRNMALCLRSRAGFVKTSAVVGMAVFLQHWYWHPYLHFISLSLAPTCVIGLNKDLALPASFSVTCLSKPSDFAYPAPLEDKKEEKKERVQTVELSTTAKARAKAKAKGDDSTMVDATPVPAPAEAEEKKLAEEKPKPEPTSFTIANPGRVTFNQQVFCRIDASQRFQPIRKDAVKYFGVLMLRDTVKDDSEIEFVRLKGPEDAEEEAEPPADFEWTITD